MGPLVPLRRRYAPELPGRLAHAEAEKLAHERAGRRESLRSNAQLRAVFGREEETLVVHLLGNHDDARHYLRSR